MHLVLASSSPRRRDLLAGLGVAFEVVSPDVDETRLGHESGVDYVARLAGAKAAAVHTDEAALVIAADTTVEIDGEVLEKPVDASDARRMLMALSGRVHRVHTGLAVRRARRTEIEVVTTAVTFATLTSGLVDWYVGTGEAMGKAGGYALQGVGGALVERVDGSVTNVIGLPMYELLALTARVGHPLIG